MQVAAIYARKSRVTEKGESIENQIRKCKSHLDILGITEVLIYKDEGFSGKNTDRPDFNRLMKDAKKGEFSILICYKFDRISRNVSDFSTLVDTLNFLGISFISLSEQFDTSSPIGKAMMNICSVFSQLERETICQRVSDNMYMLAEGGYWLGGMPPTGYKNIRKTYSDSSGKQKSYAILEAIPKEIELVKLLYDKYNELGSLSQLERFLLSSNIKTKNGKDFSKSGLSSILRNPCYVKADESVFNYFKSNKIKTFGIPNGENGVLIYKRRIGKSSKLHNIEEWIYAISEHPGFIESTTWLATQNLLDKNKSKAPALGTSNAAILSGLITCSKCNSPMRVCYGDTIPGTNSKRHYYKCTMKQNSGKTRCDGRNVNGIEIDSIVVEKIKELTINKSLFINKLKDYAKSLESNYTTIQYNKITKEIQSNTDSINNLLTNISCTTDKDIVQILLNKISELKEKNKQLTNDLNELYKDMQSQKELSNNYSTLISKICDISFIIDKSDVSQKKKLISSIIDRIYVNADTGAVNIKFKLPSAE